MDSSPSPAIARQPTTPAAARPTFKRPPSTLAANYHGVSASISGPAPLPSSSPSSALLPPFEPHCASSSPGLPRPNKRVALNDLRDERLTDHVTAALKYPTPVPTSSTHVLTSSPQHATDNAVNAMAGTTNGANGEAAAMTATTIAPALAHPTAAGPFRPNPRKRNPLTRTASTASSERVPLSPVSCIILSPTARPVRIGRSSLSCDFQLPPSNRSISRVHVRACFRPANADCPRDRVEIACDGWNGVTVHVRGVRYEVSKGMVFTSDVRGADILLDVQGSRVLLQWPRQEQAFAGLDGSDDDNVRLDASSIDDASAAVQSSKADFSSAVLPPSSPVLHLQPQHLPAAPHDSASHNDEPKPHVGAMMTPSSPMVVYEDHTSPGRNESDNRHENDDIAKAETKEAKEEKQEEAEPQQENLPSFVQDDSGSSDYEPDVLSDLDEEELEHAYRAAHSSSVVPPSVKGHVRSSSAATNPALPASFATTKDNNITSSPPRQPRKRTGKARATTPPPPDNLLDNIPAATIDAVRNHAINQLAFSRLNSAPLSIILNHLPPEHWRIQPAPAPESAETETKAEAAPEPGRELTRVELKMIIEKTDCIGVVNREGKDAAGKPLESEYYYIPSRDWDEMRSLAVTSQLGKSGLRSCRKQHKQYYWKKPK